MITAGVTFVIPTSHSFLPNLIWDCSSIELEAPSGSRRGATLYELDSDWASAIFGDMAEVRQYEHGFTMNCRVVYTAQS